MNHRSWLDISGRPRRWSAAVAVGALIAAGVVVTLSDRGVWGPVAIPRAEAQPAPTGATGGGSGGGFGAPPFPLQPPGMPDGPGGYSNGYYPAPDQSWGINIYETGPKPQRAVRVATTRRPTTHNSSCSPPTAPSPRTTTPRCSPNLTRRYRARHRYRNGSSRLNSRVSLRNSKRLNSIHRNQ